MTTADEKQAALFLMEVIEILYVSGTSRFLEADGTPTSIQGILHSLAAVHMSPHNPILQHLNVERIEGRAGGCITESLNSTAAAQSWNLKDVQNARFFQQADGTSAPLPGYGTYHFSVAKLIQVNPQSPLRARWPERPACYIPRRGSNELLCNDFNRWLDMYLGGHCLWRDLPKILKSKKLVLVGITQYIPLPGCDGHPYQWSTVSQWAINVGIWDGTLLFRELSQDEALLPDPPIGICTNGVGFRASDIAQIYDVNYTEAVEIAIPEPFAWLPWQAIVGASEQMEEDKELDNTHETDGGTLDLSVRIRRGQTPDCTRMSSFLCDQRNSELLSLR
ncbi:hypothetical protein CALVIDRAFT_563963 [Calocera viscosa TUFC12733]|uniref:Uncharacterized protein n=1 Tax=Calocera viscosa (strain TUFC12733) TaxID=1330018 RepID=A0A167M9N5_CALVF|nr:hypothetical protein CALVIDRAFT_563963 [Calocera viscosa TUFC12733]